MVSSINENSLSTLRLSESINSIAFPFVYEMASSLRSSQWWKEPLIPSPHPIKNEFEKADASCGDHVFACHCEPRLLISDPQAARRCYDTGCGGKPQATRLMSNNRSKFGMANMKFPFTLTLALLFLALFTITCSSRDDREKIRAEYGEPDRIISRGIDPYWQEIWFYDRFGVGFEFRRTAGCGSFRDVYLFQQFGYQPSPGDSTFTRQLPLPQRGDNPVSPF